MTYKLTTLILQDGDWFVARCVELGVVSQGKTVAEAQYNLKEAVELYLEDQPELAGRISKSRPIVSSLEIEHV